MMATDVVGVRIPLRSTGHDVRAVKVVLHREMLRFVNDRTRMLSMLVQPVLWLFVMGTGFGTLAQGAIPGIDYRTFMYPGMIAMTVIMTAMFSAGSIVWDREFGFLREMLVAPVSRGRSWWASAWAGRWSRSGRASSSWPWRAPSACRTTRC
nr:hypothetical protein GCM10020093_036890 [Planobispora longispora]